MSELNLHKPDEYQRRVFEWLTGLNYDTEISIEAYVEVENTERFINAVKQYIINFRSMNLQPFDNNIKFSDDYKKLIKTKL